MRTPGLMQRPGCEVCLETDLPPRSYDLLLADPECLVKFRCTPMHMIDAIAQHLQ